MMLGVVASDGKKMPPFWFEKETPDGLQGVHQRAGEHREAVVGRQLPRGQLCVAAEQRPRPTPLKNWYKENLADFWPKHLWPASSPDLNPLDFSIWSVVEAAACPTPHPSVTALIQSL